MSIESAIKNFERNGFKTRRFTTPEDLRKYLADNIVDTTVGMGGSVTLTELKICDALKGRNKIYWHAIDKSAKTFEEASLAEVYILSANALSESGEIVNIDGRGNRISGRCSALTARRSCTSAGRINWRPIWKRRYGVRKT